MIVYPNAKINLGLNVHTKLDNGYHLLQSFFIPVPLLDILEIVPNEHKNDTEFTSSGIPISGGNNLCEQAYHLLNKNGELPGVKIHLHKQIPIGAGLGGGSADASFTLNLLNSMFNLNYSTKELEVFAKTLGADCPFFIENTSKFVEGIGEVMTPISTNALKGKTLVLIFPKIYISTQEAYSGIKLQSKVDYSTFDFTDFNAYPKVLHNDFEPHIFKNYPELKYIKETLYNQGAFYASMSGSGSTLFGLFHSAPELKFSKDYTLFSTTL